jgi:hypothetical protein
MAVESSGNALTTGVRCLSFTVRRGPAYARAFSAPRKMNETMKKAADAVRSPTYQVTWADPRPDFGDHGACTISVGLIHDIVVATTRGEGDFSQQSLHPTVEGAQVYSLTATRALAGS